MYRYHVPDMSCGHCVATITKAVQGVDASAKINADLARGEISVESAADTARIEDAIKEAGYESRRL
jgi:copper chaperone